MTWHGRDAQQWMHALADEESAAGANGDRIANRDRTADRAVARLAHLIEAPVSVSTHRRPGLWLGGSIALGLAAAALFTLVGGGPSESTTALATVLPSVGRVSRTEAGGPRELAPEARVLAGDQLQARSADADLAFVSGARLHMSRSTELVLAASAGSEGVHLLEGRIDLHVPKRAPGQRWTVTTSSAEVTVVGTRFSVWFGDAGGARVTCVAVQEGRVRARSSVHEEVLGPGDIWSSASDGRGCGPELGASSGALVPRPEEPPRPAPEETATPSARPGQPQGRTSSTASGEQRGSLSRQNELFRRIVQARREGDAERARQLGRDFLRQHPQSPFADQVREELRRVGATAP
jgi:hypothetical protein